MIAIHRIAFLNWMGIGVNDHIAHTISPKMNAITISSMTPMPERGMLAGFVTSRCRGVDA